MLDDILGAIGEEVLSYLGYFEYGTRPRQRHRHPRQALPPKLKGAKVRVSTPLNQSGSIQIGDKQFAAQVDAGYVDAGEVVYIVGKTMNELVVSTTPPRS